MKAKQRFMIMAVVLVGCTATAHAQEELPHKTQSLTITGGVILETNVSGFFHSGVDGGNSRMKAGASAGGFLNLEIIRSFSVQGEMLIHYRHSGFDWGGMPGEFQYWGIEIPIYAMYHIGLKRGGQFHFGIGPYTEFGLDATYKRNGQKGDLYEKDEANDLPILRDSNTGFSMKIGYEFLSGLQLNATYKASVTNLLDANSSRVKMHPHAISIGVAYRFGK